METNNLTEKNILDRFNSKIRIFFKVSLIALVYFLISGLMPVPMGRGFTFITMFYLISGGWPGFVLNFVARNRIKKDYRKITSSSILILVGIVLITFNYLYYLSFFITLPSSRGNSIYIWLSICMLPSISGFLLSWIFLLKAKKLFKENPELILESKEIEQEETLKKQEIMKQEEIKTLYCPRCKLEIVGDKTTCYLCNQNFNELSPITSKKLRYCPRCQKNVQPKKKFTTGFWIVFIALIFTIGAPLLLLIITALSKPRCSICKKKTEHSLYEYQKSVPTAQIQAQASTSQTISLN